MLCLPCAVKLDDRRAMTRLIYIAPGEYQCEECGRVTKVDFIAAS